MIDKIWIVKCNKCGKEMEACDGFVPLFCAKCVFGNQREIQKEREIGQ